MKQGWFCWRRGDFLLQGSVRKDLQSFLRSAGYVVYHVAVVSLSGGIALSLPFIAGFIAENFMTYWNRIENEKLLLVSIEITVALFLILTFNYIGRSIRDRKTAKMADGAGLAKFFPAGGPLTRRRIKKAKEKHGKSRSVMIIASTGFQTFVNAEGDLHDILRDCLEAKIMLLNPYSEAAQKYARAMHRPDVTPLSLREHVRQSIEFLKQLKAAYKNVKLKLYSDLPHIKLTVLGDYIWMQHYHANLDVQVMPEFVLKHNQESHGLYTLYYQYFMKKWENHGIPEYDLDSDELVYSRGSGNEVRREKFTLDVPGQMVKTRNSRVSEQGTTRSSLHATPEFLTLLFGVGLRQNMAMRKEN
jgi:hypothetical protein